MLDRGKRRLALSLLINLFSENWFFREKINIFAEIWFFSRKINYIREISDLSANHSSKQLLKHLVQKGFTFRTQKSTELRISDQSFHGTLILSYISGGDYMEEFSITLVIASIMVLGYFIGYTIVKA